MPMPTPTITTSRPSWPATVVSPVSLDSFHTAESTTASTPDYHASSPYRAARHLPRELKEHCQIYLEEQIYGSAIAFLNTILFAGTSRRRGAPRSAYVPPASHLALIATLGVHPLNTTRAEGADSLEVSVRAIDYLRNVLTLVGPLNADLQSAFKFRDDVSRYRNGRPHVNDDTNDFELRLDDQLRGALSTDASIWSRAEDFWHIAGWAFNCCTAHPHRWRYWKTWLELMADAMDADWDERRRLDEEAHGKTHKPKKSSLLRESIIASYINENSRRRGVLRIVKALLADGSHSSMAMFREVFVKESRGVKKKDLKRKHKQVDLANDQFGDYYDEDCLSSGDESPLPTDGTQGQRCMTDAEIESIPLRLRLFKLASRTYYELYDPSLTNMLYEIFTTDVRSLPLQTFSLLISSHKSPLIQESLVTLLNRLIQDLLPSPRPGADPARVDPDTYMIGGLSTDILERCYLPFAAAAAKDDARVSLIMENMLLIMWANDQLLGPYEALQAAVEQGITARSSRSLAAAGPRSTRGAVRNPEADMAKHILNASAARMRALVETLTAS